MIDHIKKITIIDGAILIAQAILLLIFRSYEHQNTLPPDVIAHVIFTLKDKYILFLNLPLLAIPYSIYLLASNKNSTLFLKNIIISIMNFILLYFIAWIEVLTLISDSN